VTSRVAFGLPTGVGQRTVDSRQGDVAPREGATQLSAAVDPLLWVSSRKGKTPCLTQLDPHLQEDGPYQERLEAFSLLALFRPGGVLRLEQQRRRVDGRLPAPARPHLRGPHRPLADRSSPGPSSTVRRARKRVRDGGAHRFWMVWRGLRGAREPAGHLRGGRRTPPRHRFGGVSRRGPVREGGGARPEARAGRRRGFRRRARLIRSHDAGAKRGSPSPPRVRTLGTSSEPPSSCWRLPGVAVRVRSRPFEADSGLSARSCSSRRPSRR